MRVFLTGGTGYVGSAVLEALVKSGHHVDALVRNSEGASRVQARGATPILGDLMQPASWRDAAAAADGAVHAAVEYGARQAQFDATAVDPLTVRFTDLRERVMQLDGFTDDPKSSNEPKLEAIQMAWYEEWKEGQ